MALIGYARVSTAEQDTALQTDALRKAECERVFEDTVSGAKVDRPGLAAALAYLRNGDVLAVWRLDRLGLTAASDRNGRRTGSALYRVPFADGSHRHHHTGVGRCRRAR